MKLLDLSFRVKLPLLGAALIIVSALGVATALMLAAYGALRDDLRVNAETLGRAMAPSLLQDMLHDDVWHAFETVRAPAGRAPGAQSVKAEALFVVDNALNIFVASEPKRAPVLTPLRDLGADFVALAEKIKTTRGETVDMSDSGHLYVLTPIADDRVHFGTLIITVAKNDFRPRFYAIAWQGLLAGLAVLGLLLPISWYWGRRLAMPLAHLTERMSEVGKRLPPNINPELYNYGDELGQLFTVFNQMLAELRSHEAMEKQVVQSERLAALGRLAAAMAHEINNPLGGMLTAIDTLKLHGDVDARTMKTIDLIERGLTQIKDTVGALLVEAKVKSRNFAAKDVEDVLMLVAPPAEKKALRLESRNAVRGEAALPATLVRQILINLLLNAIEASESEQSVVFQVTNGEGRLQVGVSNGGRIPDENAIPHLFEPFFSLSDGGHGLGLWVTYQIVHQLGGKISATRDGDRLRVAVTIPFEVPHD
ncbi:sensor histidine kinase [Propionivibrio soli]|uniref:sensor histidine kinase n=1 Tax=Propionivibrio soli TaxID=2976531 RepID=UPI0021E9985A